MASNDDLTRQRVLKGEAGIAEEFCRVWLQKVSRTFALNIRVLSKKHEGVIRLAYLFMRIADTIEDDRSLPPLERQALLESFAHCFGDQVASPEEIEAFRRSLPSSWRESSDPDQFLVAHVDLVFEVYRKVDPTLRRPVDERVKEMCGGMVHYALKRENDGWFQLGTRQELLDYCYFVAGTVGLMLTDLFCRGGLARRKESLRANSVGFGLALQLVNIARDIPADGTRSTVFVPEDLCHAHGIEPRDLWNPDHVQAASKVLLDLVRLADREVRAAQTYILDLPWYEFRLRLFCLWPLLMSQDTLVLLASRPREALGGRVKIGRAQVRRILWTTTAVCWSNLALKLMFARRNRTLASYLQRVDG